MKSKIIFFFLMIMCYCSLFANETKNETMNKTMNEKDFFVLFNHKINESYNKINLLNKKPNIAKLGKEEVVGNISGKVFYHAKISGFGGLVTIRYENYCDEEGWIFNGEIITHGKITGNGNFDGKVEISGLFNATVYFDKAILGNNLPSGGTYGVSFYGEPRIEVPYQAYFE